MRSLPLFAVALLFAACDSAPSEESPVTPAVVCDTPDENGVCAEYDDVVDNEALIDGNVLTDGERPGDRRHPL